MIYSCSTGPIAAMSDRKGGARCRDDRRCPGNAARRRTPNQIAQPLSREQQSAGTGRPAGRRNRHPKSSQQCQFGGELRSAAGRNARSGGNRGGGAADPRDLRPEIDPDGCATAGIDGLELTRRLRREPRFREIPVVAFTSYAMPQEKAAAGAAVRQYRRGGSGPQPPIADPAGQYPFWPASETLRRSKCLCG